MPALAESREGGRERFEEAVRIGLPAVDGKLPSTLEPAYAAADEKGRAG